MRCCCIFDFVIIFILIENGFINPRWFRISLDFFSHFSAHIINPGRRQQCSPSRSYFKELQHCVGFKFLLYFSQILVILLNDFELRFSLNYRFGNLALSSVLILESHCIWPILYWIKESYGIEFSFPIFFFIFFIQFVLNFGKNFCTNRHTLILPIFT